VPIFLAQLSISACLLTNTIANEISLKPDLLSIILKMPVSKYEMIQGRPECEPLSDLYN
jgi:hypothetical protein